MKKLGKFLLFTAGITAACAGVYYYLQNKDKFTCNYNGDEDDDYDDFSEDLDDTDSNRSYVPLNHDGEKEEDGSFKKLSSLVSDAADTVKEKVGEKVEEFFDEDDESK